MPRVSVIVPAHDAEAYLGDALASVVRQTYEDWEVVVTDDASGDATLEVANRYGPKVEAHRSDENLGCGQARVFAIERSQGELLAFLDADDQWLPKYLEQQVALFDRASEQEGPPVGLVGCDALIMRGSELLGHTYLEQFDLPDPITLDALLKRNLFFVSTLMPREVYDDAGGFSPENRWVVEDHDLWIRVLELGYRALVNREPLAIYRQRHDQLSADLVKMSRGNQGIYRRVLERGRVNPRQRRVARRRLLYNRAVERVGLALSGQGGMLRSMPLVAAAAVANPDRWRDWLAFAARRYSRRPG